MRSGVRLIIYAVSLYIHAAAQKDKYEPLKEDWAISASTYNINRNVSDQSLPSFYRSAVYIDGSNAVVLANTKDDYRLICLNDNAQTLWQIGLSGKGVGLGKRKGNFLAIYESADKGLHALLVDGTTHQAISDKNIYSPGKENCDYIVENNPAGEFDHLVIRTSANNRSDYLSSAKLELVYLDEALSPKLYDITRDMGDGLFMGTATGDNGTHFIAYMTLQGVVVKKYDMQGKIIASLISHAYFTKFSPPVFTLDAENHNAVCFSVKYKADDKSDADICAYADFTANKMFTSAEQLLDKDYKEEMKGQIIKNPDISSVSLKSLEDLAPVKILSNGGKILVVKEIRYGMKEGYKDHYYNLHIIISTYTKAMKLVSETIVDRASEVFLPFGRTIGLHIKNNILYLVTISLVGIGHNGTVYDAIDLKTNKAIINGVAFKQKFLENGVAEGAATLWFDSSFLVSVMHVSGRAATSSSLQKMDY